MVMSSITIYYWTKINPSFLPSPLVLPLQAFANDLMVGYLLYDVIYEVMYAKQSETVLHHFLGLFVHLITRFTKSGISSFYLMGIYIAELSTPFLNLTWLLYQLQLNETFIYRFGEFLLLVSFFFCRVCLGPFLLWHMIDHKELWVGQEYSLYLSQLVCSLFIVLNVKWFFSLAYLVFWPLPRTKVDTKGKNNGAL